jgi:adenylate cyclase
MAGAANLSLGLFAPVDEFYAQIEGDRRKLFVVAIAFVLAALPIAFALGSMLSGSLRALARETDNIQKFRFTMTRSCIRRFVKSTSWDARSPPCAR